VTLNVAQMSDLHFANETLTEVKRCMEFAVNDAIAREVDCAVISGDSTDHRLDVHSPAFVELATQVRKLSDHCPVLMLQGTFSHEPPGTLDIFRLINGKNPVFVADRICQVALIGGEWIQSEGWSFSPDEIDNRFSEAEAIFTCIPTVNKAVVASAVGTHDAAEAIGQHLDILLSEYGKLNYRARERGIPTIGVTHGTVSGCKTEHGVPMIGLDHEFGTGSLFSAQCSAWMIGHIHAFQQWDLDGRKIAYPGSIARLHYGEIDPKGYIDWRVTPEVADITFVETPARQMLYLEFDGPPDLEKVRAIAADAQDSFVRVRWTIDEEYDSSADREAVMAILGGAAEVKLEARKLPVQRTRAAGMNNAASITEKLGMWCDVTNTSQDGLAERLELLQTKTPEEIVASIQ